MHELALCQSVLAVLQDQARLHGFDRVATVRLEIGALSCASAEAIGFCFAAVTRGTLADGAELELITLPGQAWCLHCGTQVAVNARHDPCPRCGGYRLRITKGEEMRVTELEVA
jgi:hydrogenase nickel incorporation protein HypA/HybF